MVVVCKKIKRLLDLSDRTKWPRLFVGHPARLLARLLVCLLSLPVRLLARPPAYLAACRPSNQLIRTSACISGHSPVHLLASVPTCPPAHFFRPQQSTPALARARTHARTHARVRFHPRPPGRYYLRPPVPPFPPLPPFPPAPPSPDQSRSARARPLAFARPPASSPNRQPARRKSDTSGRLLCLKFKQLVTVLICELGQDGAM